MNFTEFVNRVQLPRPDKFIWLMVEKEFPPTMWMLDDAYTLYMEFLEYKSTPMEQLKLSVETLLNYVDKHDIDVPEFFTSIHPNELIQLVRGRKLSPWLLLFSKSFKRFLVDRTSSEQKIILETLIRPDTWIERFEKYPEQVKKIKQCVVEMGI